jgi:serine/threonine protein kinase/Flp pilus assembly protein TadD
MSAQDTKAEVAELLAKALEYRAEQRSDWLEAACAERPELAAQVQRLAEQATQQAAAFRDSLYHDPNLGQLLSGRYRLEARLGAGAMGVVYRALDQNLQRPVAVKLLRIDLLDRDEAAARFLREAEVMASVRHPAVVTLHDRGITEDGRPYLVMELLEGASLGALLDEVRRHEGAVLGDDPNWLSKHMQLSEADRSSYLRLVTRWAAELAAGLEAVHKAGALHRDVKPSNIFLRRDGRPVLLDFGVAAREDNADLTRSGALVGTPVYMPPECLRGGSRPRPTLDVYGLSATLYHLLTLQPPHSGSATQVLATILARDPEPASRLRPGLPRDLQAILDKGLDRRPQARYASAALLESDLRAFLEYRPIVARPTTAWSRGLRRMARSTVLRGVLLTVLVFGLYFAVSSWQTQQQQARRTAYAAVVKHLPPNFTVVAPASRRVEDEELREELALLLDQATDLADDPLPSYLLRSSFRYDHGDPQGAAADMAVIAQRYPSPLAQQLAETYAAIGSDEPPRPSISLEGLPEPASPVDHYLLGYHLMRSGNYAGARALLENEQLRPLLHAQELRLAGTSFEGLLANEQRELASRLHNEAILLEVRQGQRSAASAHVISRMAGIEGRYAEALEAARAGLELAPKSHGLLINAGMMAWRLGLDGEARQHWSKAIAILPQDPKPHRNLIWLHLERGELEEVELLIDRAPFGDTPAGERQRLAHRAWVATERALQARESGDLVQAQAQAQIGADLLERARARGPLAEDAITALNRALLSTEPQGIFVGLASLLVDDPFRWRRIEQLLEHMPEDLDASSTKSLRAFLEKLKDELASQKRLEPSPR